MRIETIEAEITDMILEINRRFGFNDEITANTCPRDVGISSQILVSVISRLEDKLKIAIPSDNYIFYDKKSKSHLSIKSAAIELAKIKGHGRE